MPSFFFPQSQPSGNLDDASYSDERFVTLDAYNSPGKMPAGHLGAAENCLIVGGDLTARPGLLGLLTTLHAAPVYVLGAFRRADGTTAVVYTAGGKLYRLDKGAAASVEILGTGGVSLSLVSANAFGVRLGKYFYVCDGAGPLVRTDLTTALSSPFLSAPPSAPTVSLTSTLIDALTGGTWAPDTLTGAGQVNRLPNADFSVTVTGGGYGTGGGPSGWTPFGANPDLSTPTGETGNWLLMDNPQEGIFTTAALANDPVAGDAARYAKNFYVALTCHQSDTTGLSTVVVLLSLYSDAGGTALLVQLTRELSVPFAGNQSSVTLGTAFSSAGLSAEVLSYRVTLTAGSRNVGVAASTPGQAALHVRYPTAFPFEAALTTSVSAGQVKVSQPPQLAYTGGSITVSQPGDVGGGRAAGGQHLTRDYGAGSPQNWAAYSHVVLGLAKGAGITGLSLMLAFRQDGSTLRYYTNPFVISADGTMATCDISTVPAAIRSAFRYVEIVLGGDFLVPAASGSDLLLFGPLTGAGSLSVGFADYSYLVTEVNAATDTGALVNVLESSPGQQSGSLTPTITQAEGLVVLPAQANAAATYFAVYRYGGVFSDVPAVGRLIAALPIGADVAAGADARNPYYAWNHTTRTLTDNTPDSFILQAGVFPNSGTPVVPGRDAPPAAAQAIAEYNGRLILAVGAAVYISWLLTPDKPDALYFTTGAVLPSDPNAALKGAVFTIGGQASNDPIQALVPHNTAVIAETHTRKTLIEGYNGTNFQTIDYLRGAGYGCVAPRAALLMDNQEAVLCASGPFLFNGAAASEFGLLIENLLRPRGFGGEPVVSPAALARAAMVYHDRRLLLSVADPGQAINTRTYVYDTRNQAWTRWSFGFTSGKTLSTGTDSDNVYLGGNDGQVYTLSGSQDQAGPAAAPVAIALTVTTRGYGQGNVEQFWREDKARRIYLHAGLPMGTVVTTTIAGDLLTNSQTLPGFAFTLPYQELPSATEGVRGHWMTITAALSVTGPARIYGIRLACAESAVNL